MPQRSCPFSAKVARAFRRAGIVSTDMRLSCPPAERPGHLKATLPDFSRHRQVPRQTILQRGSPLAHLIVLGGNPDRLG